ncbi:MAG TPA: hypothetical protein PLV55_10345 [Anaerohalosphaeraceae bacterium]|nr:hypothetical protein [Anaerohalosphaeraceae bacterium]
MRIHYSGNALTNQSLATPIPLKLNADNTYIPLQNLAVRVIVELSGLATGQEKTITLLPRITNESGTSALYLHQTEKTIPSDVSDAVVVSDICTMFVPSFLAGTDRFSCLLTGTNCGTAVGIKAFVAVIEENTEYVAGAEPLTSEDISGAVNRKTTW